MKMHVHSRAAPRSAVKALVVDDEPYVCDVIARWLEIEGYDCSVARSGNEALDLLEEDTYELMVSDIMMPGTSGMELLEIVRQRYPSMAVIMATAVDNRDTGVRTLKLGAYGYVIKPFDRNELIINVANALERRRLALKSQDYERMLERKVRERTADCRRREEEIALRLVSASEYRDEETGAHIRRIGLYAALLAGAMGWGLKETDDIQVAAPMHDVGKIGIPDRILLKPGKLTADEFAVMQGHTFIGAQLLGHSDIPLLAMASEIALCHHEKWNGAGYPRGLAGERIPPSARIVAVADVYDALVHDRVYRPAFSEERALDIMAGGRGSHFDPEIFDCFLTILPDLREIRKQVADEVKTSRYAVQN